MKSEWILITAMRNKQGNGRMMRGTELLMYIIRAMDHINQILELKSLVFTNKIKNSLMNFCNIAVNENALKHEGHREVFTSN